MDLIEYQTAAARTMRPEETHADGQHTYGRDSVLHFTLGLAGEAAELTEKYLDNAVGFDALAPELGDTSWYVAGLATIFEMSLEEIGATAQAIEPPVQGTHDVDRILLSLQASIGTIVEHVKKVAFFNHELDFVKIQTSLARVWWHIDALAPIFGMPLDLILTKNIAKLRARYPTGFDQERSR